MLFAAEAGRDHEIVEVAVSSVPASQAWTAAWPVRTVNGYDPVFVAEALNDRHGSRLDDEEVAAHLASGKQNLAGLDRAKVTVVDQTAEFRREQQQYLEAGERVVVLLRSIGRPQGGTEYDLPEVHVWTVRDGKIVDFEGCFDTATVLRTLQLQPRG